MQKIKRSWLSVLGAIFTITVLILYIMVCCVPFMPLGILWIFNLPGLIFPFLFFILLIITIVYFITQSKWKWKCLVVLLLGLQQLAATFPLHISHTWTNEKNENSIRILSWNVNSWDIANFTIKNGNTFHEPMMNFIKTQNADILCFQEFFDIIDPKISPSFIKPLNEIGFPYYYFAPYSYTVSGKFQTGLAIFSKWPIK
ncbi:MAG: endonuclease/exonuclease/phosphatase family protein, partial [Ginsengibacter sp.]